MTRAKSTNHTNQPSQLAQRGCRAPTLALCCESRLLCTHFSFFWNHFASPRPATCGVYWVVVVVGNANNTHRRTYTHPHAPTRLCKRKI